MLGGGASFVGTGSLSGWVKRGASQRYARKLTLPASVTKISAVSRRKDKSKLRSSALGVATSVMSWYQIGVCRGWQL